MNDRKWLYTRDVARLFNVGEWTVRHWIRNRLLDFSQTESGINRFSQADIEEFRKRLEERKAAEVERRKSAKKKAVVN